MAGEDLSSTLARNLSALPPGLRATVQAARRTLRSVAPEVMEVAYRSRPPSSPSAMWRLARYRLHTEDVAGLGAFASHASLFLHRGRELDDGSGLLEGGGARLRFVRLRSPAEASSARLKELLRRAFREARGAGAGAKRARRGAPPPGTSPIDAYLAKIPVNRRAALEQVRATIRAALPRAEECLSYGMPAFRVEGVVVAGFLATSQGCSYYPFSGTTLGTLAASLAGYGRTKSALHFPADRPLPATLVRRLLRARLAEVQARSRRPRP